MKRKILAVFVILLIAAQAILFSAAESAPDVSGAEAGVRMTKGEFLVEFTDGNEGRGITIVGWETGKKRANIPGNIEKVPVTAIAKGAFAEKPLLEEVVIPVSVREISPDAFEGSQAIRKITVHKKNPRFLSVSGILYDRDSLAEIYYPAAKFDLDYTLVKKGGDGGPLTYTLTVSGYKGDKARLDIPGKVEGYPVTGIGDRAFAGLDFLKRVKLPRYLETVGEDVFEKCPLLEQFSLSFQNASYEIIERDLYDKRTGKLVWYPEAQAYFKYEMIGMDEMSYIIITGAGTKKKKVTIPPKLNGVRVSEIVSGAFENNPVLTEIDIPDSIFRMGVRTFAFCPKLGKVTLGNNIGTIPLRAFYECTALKEIVVPDSVTTISDNAFSDCTALESVTLGRRLTALGNSAFSGCSALTEVFIPEWLSAIGENAFAGCRALANILVDEKNKAYTDIDGVLFNKAETAILRFPEGRSGKQYMIPDGVEQIGNAAFSFCQRLSTIGLPANVTLIGNYAFFYCAALYNIHLGETVVIGNDAFSGCTNLDNINFPESLHSIGDRAFASCRMLQTARIPSNVVSIGENAFQNCERLTQVSLSRNTEVSSTAFTGTRAEITYID
jgi:hypothetical protein